MKPLKRKNKRRYYGTNHPGMNKMNYYSDFKLLSRLIRKEDDYYFLEEYDIEIFRLPFESSGYGILPGIRGDILNIQSNRENKSREKPQSNLSETKIERLFSISDAAIQENQSFSYLLFKNRIPTKAEGVIFLFHGLNERFWDKYLPWALALQKITGKAVILFALPFHINRSPKDWSNSRLMNEVSKERKKHYGADIESSFVNAALSTRLQDAPLRFFLAGIQAYSDVLQLIRTFQSGNHPFIDRHASIDLFGYSIGALLAEILLMTNESNLFEHSRLFLFCGGPTLDKLSPASRSIMDQKAVESLFSYYLNTFDDDLNQNLLLRRLVEDPPPEFIFLKSMLQFDKMKTFREYRLRQLNEKLLVVGLTKDTVVSPQAILKTFAGNRQHFQIPVHIMDFPFEYSHQNPFPANEHIQHDVNRAFTHVFRMAGNHFSKHLFYDQKIKQAG